MWHFDVYVPFVRYLIWICLQSYSVLYVVLPDWKAVFRIKVVSYCWSRYMRLVLSKALLLLYEGKFNSVTENLNFCVPGWSFNCSSEIVRYRTWTLGGNERHFPLSDVNYHRRRPAFISFSGIRRLLWSTCKWKYGWSYEHLTAVPGCM